MSASPKKFPPHAYQLAVASDTAILIDADAALAMSRAAVRTLMALSPRAAALVTNFMEAEIYRLSVDCAEESEATIAIIRDSLC